jgi:hypothetical protein
MKATATFLVGFFSALLIMAVAILVREGKRIIKVHTLTQPLKISSGQSSGGLHILPVGTTLYFEGSFPEGFSRYKVYINVDRMPLALRDLADPNEIDPLEARAFDSDTPREALRR